MHTSPMNGMGECPIELYCQFYCQWRLHLAETMEEEKHVLAGSQPVPLFQWKSPTSHNGDMMDETPVWRKA